jgi:hypothetical protein
MRILCPIVQSFVLPMFDRQTHLLTSRAIARKLIGDHDAWRIAQALQKLLEETCGGFRVALALDKNVEDIAILIDSPPKIMRLAADFDEEVSGAREFRPRALSGRVEDWRAGLG